MLINTHDSNATIALGLRLGKYLNAGDVLTLKGDLAGGKTTFTKGIGKALNIKEVINSPTFNILKIYHGEKTLFHIDAYRLEGNDYDLGFEEFLDEGICVVEWPEYFMSYLPKEYLEISFKALDDTSRAIEFKAHGKHYETILKEFEHADTLY